ncbi:hypothetical protein [Gulosibacter faecalis]|uniref:DUF2993 domain-containing protein n=1 Tax=Gulosibacter faecalis TaxID=272240 RepID=A0ABW5UWK1_9MICO|nr:hypothetical protein [Gulosibacter faecalis]
MTSLLTEPQAEAQPGDAVVPVGAPGRRRSHVWLVRVLAVIGVIALAFVAVQAGLYASAQSRLSQIDSSVTLAEPNQIDVSLATNAQFTIQSDDYVTVPTLQVFGSAVDGVSPYDVEERADGTLRITANQRASLPGEDVGAEPLTSAVLSLPTGVAERVTVRASVAEGAFFDVYSPLHRLEYTGSGAWYLDLQGELDEVQISAPFTNVTLIGPIHDAEIECASLTVDFQGELPEHATLDANDWLTVRDLPRNEPVSIAGTTSAVDWFVEQGIEVVDPAERIPSIELGDAITADLMDWDTSSW